MPRTRASVFYANRDSFVSSSALSFTLTQIADVVQRRILVFCILGLVVVVLICILSAAFLVPMIYVRNYLFNGTIKDGAIFYVESYEDHKWMLGNYPDGIQILFDILKKALNRVDEVQTREQVFEDMKLLCLASWHDCYAYLPLIVFLLVLVITFFIYIQVHPAWSKIAIESPMFGIMLMLAAVLLLQLSLLFKNVQLHRDINNYFKQLSVMCSESFSDPEIRENPITFCMAAPTLFSTVLLFSLFLTILIICSIMDLIDSTE